MKFKVDNNVSSNGTCLQGHFTATFSDLVAALGEPTECDDYKVSGEWKFVSEEGKVFTLYDWKQTSLYDSGLPSVAGFRARMEPQRFNIGGHGFCGELITWLEAQVNGSGTLAAWPF